MLSNIAFIYGVAAGKGGVGKSTLTCLLAHTLKKEGKRVGILDADLYGPSIPIMLGVDSFPKTVNGFVEPAIGNGIPYFSFSFLKDGKAAVRAPVANQVLKKCASEIAWGELDVLLIDFPPGTGDIQLTVMQEMLLSGMLYVSTSSKVSISDMEKACEMGQSMGLPSIGFVENMGSAGKVEALAKKMHVPFLGAIPRREAIETALDGGQELFVDEVQPVYDALIRNMESTENAFHCDLEWEIDYATESN